MTIEILKKMMRINNEKKLALEKKDQVASIEKKTEETMKKRAARVGKEPEVPSDITASKRDRNGFIEIGFKYLEQEYKLKGKGTLEEFTSWINEYVKVAETCTTCDKLLLPGDIAGVGEDGGYTHMTDGCSFDLIMLAGRVNATGQIEIPKEWIVSSSETKL